MSAAVAWRPLVAAALLLAGCADPAPAVSRAAAAAAAAARQTELVREWAQASQDLPNLLFALEDRLDVLGEARTLPPGLDGPALATARTELAALRAGWARATERVQAGDLGGAVASARDLRDRAGLLWGRLGAP